MHTYLTLAALLLAAPVAAQTMPPADHSKMQGMSHDNMAGMKHDPQSKLEKAMPPMNHAKMQGMSHSKMGNMGNMGEMMKNTPANPYAEAGMAMHHKMMVIGTDASETWARQMIEHHRGGIAISKIAVAQAADNEARSMAQKNIAVQETEVANLQSWLKQHDKSAQ